MTRRRWIADEVSGDHAALTGDHARHLSQVLRARVGQEFDISTGRNIRVGRITSVQADRVEFELAGAVTCAVALPVTVVLSIFKFDRMEWAIEKCTELGIAAIVPLIAARTEPRLASAAAKRVERWRRIANQASEQSRRILPPEIPDPMKLEHALALKAEVRIVLSEVEENVTLTAALLGRAHSFVLAFGPEGGWKEHELAAFTDAGWHSASLGPAILRAETAAIAAVAICQSILQSSGLPRSELTAES